MKHSLVVAALTAAAMPAAFAQSSVTLYGIADAGISADRAGGAGQGTAVRLNSGYMSSSRFGITGAEDLGAGLKAVFTLELGYDLDTGGFKLYRGNPGGATASPQAAGGIVNTNPFGTNITGGFNRRSFVGLQGPFGTVALGRDYTPFFWAHIATDNLGYGLYGNLQNGAALTGTGADLWVRASNAVFYTSPKMAGLTVRAMLSAGSESFGGSAVAGQAISLPKHANQMYSIGAEYGAGPLTAAAAFQQVRLPAVVTTGTGTAAITTFTGGINDRQDWMIGAKYNFGPFSLGGGYARFNPAGAANNTQYWVGGTLGAGKGTVLLQVSRVTQEFAPNAAGVRASEGRADTLALAYTYPLSRRTTGYASYGYVRNNATSAIGLFASDNSVPAASAGANPRGLVIGVRHSF